MGNLRKVIGHEVAQLIPVWLFFFLTFSLLRLTQSVAVSEQGLKLSTPSLVLVGSLIVAKVFLVMDLFKFMNRYDERPIIYGVLWKGAIYWLGAVAFFFIEQFVEALVKHHDWIQAQAEFWLRVRSPWFGLCAIWLAVLIFSFCATRELSRVLGKKRFLQIWFGPPLKVISNDSDKVA
jgi:hypothetical protein